MWSSPSLSLYPDPAAGLSPPRRRWPWWPASRGRGVWLLVVLVFLFSRFSPANNQAAGSRSAPVFLPPLPQAHGDGSEAEGWSRVGGDSYAGTSLPNPWRHVASVVVASTTLSLSFFNNFVADPPLLDFDLGDSLLESSIWCCLWRFYLKMQQPQILEFMCLPNFAMSGSSSCTTRLSIGGRPACNLQDVSMLLQVRNLHMRKGVTAPIPCFSAQLAVAM